MTGTLGTSASRVSPGLTGNGAVFLAGGHFNPNSYVDFGTTVAAVGTADFTMMFRMQSTWTTADGTGHGELFGTRDDPSGGNFISVRMNAAGGFGVEILDNAGGAGLGHAGPLNDGQPHHVAFSRSGTSFKLYVDGVLVSTATSSHVLEITNVDGSGGPTPLRLGRSMPFDCCDNFHTIELTADDVRIYDSALSDGDVNTIANDQDEDGVHDAVDNCPATANADQTDTDGDGQGDACDPDDDGDGVADGTDNCSLTANADQTDTDGDGQGNACDTDDDNDGVPDATDACPLQSAPGTFDGCTPSIAGLIQQVNGLTLPHLKKAVLLATLRGAQHAVDHDRPRTATLLLKVFMVEVQLIRRAGYLSASTANTLISYTQSIISGL